MKSRILIGIAAVATALSILPARADGPTDYVDRYMPGSPGEEKTLTYFFGPYTIPPGHDANRLTVDLPLTTGYITAVAPNLLDARTGEEPTELTAHIHHAHWFRVTEDPQYEYYSSGLSWVFGTGEEKTQGSLDDRAAVDPTGPRYGIYVDGTTPQLLIYMIHNKTAGPLLVNVTLTVKFIRGTRAEIEAKTGRQMHALSGRLWGQTRDATYKYPVLGADNGTRLKAASDGIAITMGGHLHPGGKEVVIANLGPNATCSADADGDGWPGVTILNSRKFERLPDPNSKLGSAWPWSEDYQLGPSKFGWRAPIHKNDVLQQFAPYDVGTPEDRNATLDGKTHASYQAMSYAGIYVDRELKPAPLAGDTCNRANYEPWLIGDDTAAVQAGNLDPDRYIPGVKEGIINHEWDAIEPHCGLPGTEFSGPCENRGGVTSERGDYVDTINTGGFLYLPGDQNVAGPLGALPLVKKGTQLRLVNADAAFNARHTFTSCAAPCKGDYTANFPLPDGDFDTGKLGNLDPIDGGLNCGAGGCGDTLPVYTLDTTSMQAGVRAFYCRIHPFMRGAFEIVA